MSIFIRHETLSQDQSQRQPVHPVQLDALLHKLAIKCLRSSKNILNQQFVQNIEDKYQELVSRDENVVDFLEYLIYSIFNQVDKLQQLSKIDIVHKDYQILEQAVQKSQAEIRKHIRIEQQLKIYLDSLEQKSQELQKKLELEEQKYYRLFQCMKQIEEERKDLLKKIMKFEEVQIQKLESKEKMKSNSNFSTINEQFYKDYLGARKTKVNKGKHVIDKLNGRKLSDKKSNTNLNIIDGSIQINLSNNIVVNKKGSYDQNLNRGQAVSHNSSIRELTKTVQMKKTNPSNVERRPNRKISKYKTESGQFNQKRQQRSNSVCN